MACCQVLDIEDPELVKPAGILCRHCSNGCSIYPTRPNACRDWLCMWRELSGLLDESWRPDRSGVLMQMAEVAGSDVRIPCFEILDDAKVDWIGLAALVAPYLRAGDDVRFGLVTDNGKQRRNLPLSRGLPADADLREIKSGLLGALQAMKAWPSGARA